MVRGGAWEAWHSIEADLGTPSIDHFLNVVDVLITKEGTCLTFRSAHATAGNHHMDVAAVSQHR